MRKSEIKDSNLVVALQQGDKNAIAILVKRWHLHFCKFAFWYCKDADIAKDIAQESWVIIINKIDALENPEKFKSWAISIVNRKSIDYLRTQQRELNNLKKFYNDKPVDSEENILSEQEDVKKLLLKSIDQLPMNQQVVLKLFYTENYTLKEIGKLLNISLGTAKSRLYHAREKLKLILKK